MLLLVTSKSRTGKNSCLLLSQGIVVYLGMAWEQNLAKSWVNLVRTIGKQKFSFIENIELGEYRSGSVDGIQMNKPDFRYIDT